MRAIATIFCFVLLGAAVHSPALTAQDDDARVNRADRTAMRETRETMRALALDLGTLQELDGEYPSELKAIVDADLRETLPKDGWDNEFHYQLSNEHAFELTSYGSDGKAGGRGAARDIVWTSLGELRQLTDDEKAELDAEKKQQLHQARRVVAHERMVVVGTELVDYRRNGTEWPESLDDVKPEAGGDDEALIADCFTDPWGNEFDLRLLPHDNFAIICYGKDGEEGGRGHNADFAVTEREVRRQYEDAPSDPWGGYTGNQDWQTSDLADSVMRYKKKHGELPEELDDLLKGPPGEAIRTSLPDDSWGNPYAYVKLGDDEFYIVSMGKDEIQGGIKDNADSIYPQPGEPVEEPYPESEADGVGIGGNGEEEEEADADELKIELANEVMLNIAEQATAYMEENGSYPSNLDDIAERLPGEEVPLDPWDAEYSYELVKDEDGKETGFKLTCLGADSTEGGEEADADFSYDQDLERTPPPEED